MTPPASPWASAPASSRSPAGCWRWPWSARGGRAIPGRLLGGAAWTASVVLTGYGGLLVAVGALVLGRLISPSGPIDRTALRWHVFLWDLWFLVWGLLLGVAAWQYGRESRRRGTR